MLWIGYGCCGYGIIVDTDVMDMDVVNTDVVDTDVVDTDVVDRIRMLWIRDYCGYGCCGHGCCGYMEMWIRMLWSTITRRHVNRYVTHALTRTWVFLFFKIVKYDHWRDQLYAKLFCVCLFIFLY